MDIPWGLLVVVVGFAYGALTAGKQDKSRLLWRGVIIGVVIALILVVLSFVTGSTLLGIAGLASGFGLVVTALVLSVLFVIGVWLGDLVTGARHRSR